MRRIADGEDATPPPTIEDSSALDDVEAALRALGFAPARAAGG
jgi:hypothetical protein